ncbi:MAG: glycoside hydrolase family 15 protein [Actinobacteria bacterium]|nr:glycoside hydrolase family 15 protein [Actinomycetota bacterium]MCL5986171.1 glycoside hydrolase family 15 protein [Actinomycetota bacterium]
MHSKSNKLNFIYDEEVEDLSEHIEDKLIVSNNRIFVLQSTNPELFAFVDDIRWPNPASDNWMYSHGCFFMVQDLQSKDMARSIDGTLTHKKRKYIPNGSLLNVLGAFDSAITLSLYDFCVPNKDLWVRRLRVKNVSKIDKNIRIILFIAPRTCNEKGILKGRKLKNNVFIFDGNIEAPYVAIACDNKVDDYIISRDAYQNAYIGNFEEDKRIEDPDRVELALAIDLSLKTAETKLVNFFISFGKTRDDVLQLINQITINSDELFVQTRKWWGNWFKEGITFHSSSAKLDWLYRVNLMVSKMCQAENGAVPYIGCGDYDRMAWVRDNVWYAVGMDYSGHFDEAQKALDWCFMLKRRKDGCLYTNYLVDPNVPKWTQLEHDFYGEILTGIWVHYIFTQNKDYLSEGWITIKNCAEIIIKNISQNGLIAQDYSIWEDNLSQNTFTSGVSAFGLLCASQIAEALGKIPLHEQWRHYSEDIVKAIKDLCYKQEIECFTESPDSIYIDGSVLILFSWFPIFRVESKFYKCVENICNRLWHKKIGGLRRREKELNNPRQDWDKYPWPGVTLWAADAYLEMGDDRAFKFLNWVIKNAMPEGILAENVHPTHFSRFPMPSYSSMGLVRTLLCLAGIRFNGYINRESPILKDKYGEIRLENLTFS